MDLQGNKWFAVSLASRFPSGGGGFRLLFGFRLLSKIGGGSAASFSFSGLGGVLPPFQNLRTSLSAALWGRELCPSCDSSLKLRKSEGEEEPETSVSELNVKGRHEVKDTRSDLIIVMCQVKKVPES